MANDTSFKKGMIPWNKGMLGYRAGYVMSEDTKRKIGLANSGNKSGVWKGDFVGYDALHDWIQRYKEKPNACEFCGGYNRRIEWANKSHQYKRILEDWIALCVPCHKKYDRDYTGKTPNQTPKYGEQGNT